MPDDSLKKKRSSEKINAIWKPYELSGFS